MKNYAAFPVAAFGPIDQRSVSDPEMIHQRGMSLRDYYIGVAMRGLLNRDDLLKPEELGRLAREYAEACLEKDNV